MKKLLLTIPLVFCLGGCVTLGGSYERESRGTRQTESATNNALEQATKAPISIVVHDGGTLTITESAFKELVKPSEVRLGEHTEESTIYTWFNSLSKSGSVLVALFIVFMVFGGVKVVGNLIRKLHPIVDMAAHVYKSKRIQD